MIDNLAPYPTYVEPGLAWLSVVPSGWRILRGKNIFSAIDERSETGEEELLTVSANDGVVPRSQKTVTMFKAESYVGHKLCWPGDLVINSLWAWMQGLGFAHHHGLVSSAYSVYRLRPAFTFCQDYLHYTLRSDAYKWELMTRSKGVWLSRLQLSDLAFLDMPILVPPPDEQAAIVRYLDHIDRRIRRYIRAKQKLIALLNEQKQAIVQQAVTRGLDPDVRLKPSGVEWLGEVPFHWEIRSVKQLVKIMRGKFTFRPRNDPSLYDGPYPFIQTGDVARAAKAITTYRQTLNERGLAVSKVFPRGTLVMTIAANIGDVAILDFEACFPDSIVGFIPHSDVDRDYLYYVFFSMKAELLRQAPVNTQGNLNVDRVGAQKVALAPRDEQRAIVRSTEQRTAALNNSIGRIRDSISLLREYRTRLIADVVTGRLDVRAAAAALPDKAKQPLDEASSEGEPGAGADDLAEDVGESEEECDADVDGIRAA